MFENVKHFWEALVYDLEQVLGRHKREKNKPDDWSSSKV